MFTQRLFSLTEFTEAAALRVERDCRFAFVGKTGTALSPRLVACRAEKHLHAALAEEGVSGVIVTEALRAAAPERLGLAVAEDPVAALNLVQERLARDDSGQWAGFDSRIHESVRIFPGAYVAPRDVVIAEGAVIHPNAVILPRTLIGRHSTVGPGTVVGADAFEVDATATPHRIIPQSGGVKIGDFVDLQAKCTIVRATFGGFTEIGDETKFDCQVHFAHDCRAGRRVRIAACAELSGRVEVGDGAFLGPNVSITNGCRIGARAHVTIGAVVTRDVPEDGHVTGNFALPHERWLNFIRSLR